MRRIRLVLAGPTIMSTIDGGYGISSERHHRRLGPRRNLGK